MIAFATVDIGSGGLPACSECSAARPPVMRPAAEVVADVRGAIEAWRDGPGPNVCFGGGDSFSHPELPGLVADAFRLGVERLRLTTAGPALSQGMNACGAIDAGVRHAEVVVLSPAQGDSGDGPPFPTMLEGIRAFLETANDRGSRVAVVGRVMACRHTFPSVPSSVAGLAAAGVVAITVEFAPRAAQPDETWFRAVFDSGVVNRAWVQFEQHDARGTHSAYSPFAGVDARRVRAWTEVGQCG